MVMAKSERPLKRGTYTKSRTVPIAAGPCVYCQEMVIKYGPQKANGQKPENPTPKDKRIGLETRLLEFPQRGPRKTVWNLPNPSCPTCLRDLHHYEKSGRFPEGSVFNELGRSWQGLRVVESKLNQKGNE